MRKFLLLFAACACVCLIGCGASEEPLSKKTTDAEITTSQTEKATDAEIAPSQTETTTAQTTAAPAGYYDYFTAEEIEAAKKAIKNYFENEKEDSWYISDVRDFTRNKPLDLFEKSEPGTVIMFIAIVDAEKTPDYSWPEEIDVILQKDANGDWQVKDFGW